MAARQQQSGEGFVSHIATMSKSQLYDLMSQMKVLIEQNQDQARQILIDNPTLTRALFQAQIMLGMVQPPKTTPDIPQQSASQTEPAIPPAKQQIHLTPSQPQSQSQPPIPPPPLNFQPQPIPTTTTNVLPPQQQQQQQQQQQNKSYSSQNLPAQPPPQPSVPLPAAQFSTVSGIYNQPPLHPPLPQQPRPVFQVQQQIVPPPMMPVSSLGGPPPHQLFQQTMFPTGGNPQPSFAQAQPSLPAQPSSQQLYPGAPHIGMEYNMQAGISMQPDRTGPWHPINPDMRSLARPQLPGGAPPLVPGQMNQNVGAQAPPRLPSLTPDMEKALFQQVMSLTPEQINLLPPEQRQQVLELQDMLR